jgi:heme/copper-type cytochrome/quinol oxidase subunit 2
MYLPTYRRNVDKMFNHFNEQFFRTWWEPEFLMCSPVFKDLYEFGFFRSYPYVGRLGFGFNIMRGLDKIFKVDKENMAFRDMCEIDAYMVTLDDKIDILKNSSFKRLLDTTRHLKIPTYSFVKFSITSNDVLHSFSIPSVGIKIDAVTGRLNDMVTFFAKEALLVGQCSELCGAGHYGMPIVIECVHPNKFFIACTSDL